MNAAGHLTREQLLELERDLRSECARLERSRDQTAMDDTPPPAGSAHLAGAHAEGRLALVLETRMVFRHEALVDAMHRLEAGTYGTCLGCGEAIPYERLVVMPEATHCVACRSAI